MMSESEQLGAVAAYRHKRDIELASSVPIKAVKEAAPNLELTPEEAALCKKLGITKRELLKLMEG